MRRKLTPLGVPIVERSLSGVSDLSEKRGFMDALLANRLQRPQQPFIFRMLADPKPDDFVAVDECNGPIVIVDAGRVNGARRMDSLELQAVVLWVIAKAALGGMGSVLNRLGELCERLAESFRRVRGHSESGSSGRVLPARCSASAWSAIRSNSSGERANNSCQRSSELNSSSIHAPNRSCSSGDNCCAFSNASRSLVVIARTRGWFVRELTADFFPLYHLPWKLARPKPRSPLATLAPTQFPRRGLRG